MDSEKIWNEIRHLKRLLVKRGNEELSQSSSQSIVSPPPLAKRPRRRIISSDSSEDEQVDVTHTVASSSDKESEDPFSVLGEDPTMTTEFGDDIHSHIAVRWNNILCKGLKKENRTELIKKYLPPKNCTYIQPPLLNGEIKAASNESGIKRDKRLEEKQTQLGAAITNIGRAVDITLKISDKTIRDQILKYLGDGGQILTDLHYIESLTRRSLLLQGLSKTTQDAMKDVPRDKYLFGESLSEKLKAMKACSKSAADLKPKNTKQRADTSRPTIHNAPETFNWRGSSRRTTNVTAEGSNPTAAAGGYQRRPAAVTSRRPQTSQALQRPKRN